MDNLFTNIIENNKKYTDEGLVASYIPELSKANKNHLGLYAVTLDGREFFAGDYDVKFTMQSISKVISLILAIMDNGQKKVFSMVGTEPTGDSFNSIAALEVKDMTKPYNPMINAGAIVISSLIKGKDVEEKVQRTLDFTRMLANNDNIHINKNVFMSEKLTGDRNRALAYFMKGNGSLTGNVDEILDVYFNHCSMEVTCKDIARIGSVIANDGILPWSGERVISKEICRIVKTLMITCGLYDESGAFAMHIGIPAKSGVGGGIMCAVPKRMGIGVFGPSLDEKGNSIGGMHVLRELSNELDLNIF